MRWKRVKAGKITGGAVTRLRHSELEVRTNQLPALTIPSNDLIERSADSCLGAFDDLVSYKHAGIVYQTR